MMLISDVEPIGNIGINLLGKENSDELIDKIIELPLRKACKLFRKKGIETVMSSANKNNILKPGEKPIEKEDVEGGLLFYPPPTFEDAGKGYVWIMLNFDTLSDENKDLLFRLEEKRSKTGEKIGEKAIWFVRPDMLTNLDYQMKTGKIGYMFAQSAISPGESPINKVDVDERYVKFDNKHIILAYNNRYPVNTVIIRRPINTKTTVKEVEDFFAKFAEMMKEQPQIAEHKKEIKEHDSRTIED